MFASRFSRRSTMRIWRRPRVSLHSCFRAFAGVLVRISIAAAFQRRAARCARRAECCVRVGAPARAQERARTLRVVVGPGWPGGNKPGGNNAKANLAEQRRSPCRLELRRRCADHETRPDRWIDRGAGRTIDIAFFRFARSNRRFCGSNRSDAGHRTRCSGGHCGDIVATSGIRHNVASNHAAGFVKRDHRETIGQCRWRRGAAKDRHAEFRNGGHKPTGAIRDRAAE